MGAVGVLSLGAAELSIGGRAPAATVATLDGAAVSLRSLERAPVTVLIFLSSECPVSNEYVPRLNALARDYAGRVNLIGVNSNRNESPAQARQHAAEYQLAFSVYKDPNNKLADLLGITVTPQVVVLDGQQKLRYRGRIDDSQRIARVTRADLRLALDAVLAERPVESPETKAFGCTIRRVQ